MSISRGLGLLAAVLAMCSCNRDATPTETKAQMSVTPLTPSFPHLPLGYTKFLEIPANAVPPTARAPVSGGTGTAGATLNVTRGLTVTTDATAPASPSNVFKLFFPAGLAVGTSPANLYAWDAAGSGTEYSKIYLSITFKFVGPDWQMQATGDKFGFIAYGQPTTSAHNQGFFSIPGNGSSTTPGTSFQLQFNQQNNVTRVIPTGHFMSIGGWHQWEAVMEINSAPNVADGKITWWQDGTLILQKTDIVYRTTGNTLKFYDYKLDPTWGGNGGPPRPRADSVYVDHIAAFGKK